MKKIDFVILFLIIAVGLAVRLYHVTAPMGDFHSWRQSDTAAVARHFVTDGFDLLHPRYDDISSVSTGLDNPNGYRMVEFPIYNALFAALYKYMPILSLEVYGRLVSIVFSLITLAVVYYFARKESGLVAACIASLVYAVFPFFVFFSRVILPEPMAISCVFISLFFLYQYMEAKSPVNRYSMYTLAIISFAAALLAKPTAAFYGIPLLFIFILVFLKRRIAWLECGIFFVLSAAPMLIWRQYITAYPEGIPPDMWLITSVNTYLGQQNIFFKPAFFRWVFYERISRIILGTFAIPLLVIGLLAKQKRYFLYSIMAGALAYLFVFQGGNVQHAYYQTLILPALALFVGIGVQYITDHHATFLPRWITYPTILALLIVGAIFSWYDVKDYYGYSSELVQIAAIVNSLTQPSDRIVTDRIGDTTLMYLMNRRGAPALFAQPDELKKRGYTYVVTMNKETEAKFKKLSYQVVFENDKFALIHL